MFSALRQAECKLQYLDLQSTAKDYDLASAVAKGLKVRARKRKMRADGCDDVMGTHVLVTSFPLPVIGAR